MAGFRFKFEAVLKARQRAEEQRQRELAVCLRQKVDIEAQIRSTQDAIRQSKRDLADGLVGAVDMNRVSQFARFSGQAAVQAMSMVQQLAVVSQQIEAARLRLVEAMKQRKAMELLRDRHRQLWIKELDRRETAALDELAVQSYARQHQEVRT